MRNVRNLLLTTRWSILAIYSALLILPSLSSANDSLLLDDEPTTDASDSLLGGDNSDDLLGGGDDDLLGGDDDDLLGDDDDSGDLLSTDGPEENEADIMSVAAEAHAALFKENRFPSATACATCHPDHYREWSVSSHAYAQLSPVFNAMHATIVKQTNGTNGDFCIRCHNQVGMQMEEPVFMSNLDRHPASREGITCIVCHRIDRNYGKVSGRTSLVEGDIFEPVFGPSGNDVLEKVLADKGKYKVNTDREKQGRNIHAEAVELSYMSSSGFCGMCHDVNLLNGFRLEEAFSQYKNTEAAKRGESCQDCHMGKIPGIKSGYDVAAAAVVGGKKTAPRKRTNHMFAGPDYSIVHPGIFPHNTQAQELATLAEWLEFDYDIGWGTDEFEDSIPEDYPFPKAWAAIDDRYEAREILEDQWDLLHEIKVQRYQIQRRAFQLDKVVVKQNNNRGLKFSVLVRNGTDGHGAPTGFDAERLIYLEIAVKDKHGEVIFRSGDRDPNGDVRDIHSSYVHNWELPIDKQLFNLQSKFLTRNVRGGEREQILAVNYSLDPLPYIRPDARSTILTARPFAARKQAKILPPGGTKWADYKVSRKELTEGPYTVNIKFWSQMVPVNLVRAISGVGFDYNMSEREIADRIVEDAHVLWDRTITIDGDQDTFDLLATEEEIMAPPYDKSKLREAIHDSMKDNLVLKEK